MTPEQIKFVADAMRPRIAGALRDWYPDGKQVGDEWRIGDVQGNPGSSFGINIFTGAAGDLNPAGEKCKDIVSVYAKRHGIKQGEAAQILNDRYGLHICDAPKPVKAVADWTPLPIVSWHWLCRRCWPSPRPSKSQRAPRSLNVGLEPTNQPNFKLTMQSTQNQTDPAAADADVHAAAATPPLDADGLTAAQRFARDKAAAAAPLSITVLPPGPLPDAIRRWRVPQTPHALEREAKILPLGTDEAVIKAAQLSADFENIIGQYLQSFAEMGEEVKELAEEYNALIADARAKPAKGKLGAMARKFSELKWADEISRIPQLDPQNARDQEGRQFFPPHAQVFAEAGWRLVQRRIQQIIRNHAAMTNAFAATGQVLLTEQTTISFEEDAALVKLVGFAANANANLGKWWNDLPLFEPDFPDLVDE